MALYKHYCLLPNLHYCIVSMYCIVKSIQILFKPTMYFRNSLQETHQRPVGVVVHVLAPRRGAREGACRRVKVGERHATPVLRGLGTPQILPSQQTSKQIQHHNPSKVELSKKTSKQTTVDNQKNIEGQAVVRNRDSKNDSRIVPPRKQKQKH
jgi:hypothetical protein